jgi:hypothetical protein
VGDSPFAIRPATADDGEFMAGMLVEAVKRTWDQGTPHPEWLPEP